MSSSSKSHTSYPRTWLYLALVLVVVAAAAGVGPALVGLAVLVFTVGGFLVLASAAHHHPPRR